MRRRLVDQGLLLMMSRGLVSRLPSQNGFSYLATESAAPFISSLTSDYFRQLVVCAKWAVKRFENVATEEVRRITHSLFEEWSTQFQPMDRTRGLP